MNGNAAGGVPCARAVAAAHIADQARTLMGLTQEARFVQFALNTDADAARDLADGLQQALEAAIDADTDTERAAAEQALHAALAAAATRRLRVEAELSDLQIDGLLGATTMRVLTAVMSPVEATG